MVAVNSKGKNDVIYWTEHIGEKYLYIIPVNYIKIEGDTPIVNGEKLTIIESWSNGVPAID